MELTSVRSTQTETEENQNPRPKQAKFARTTETQAQTQFAEKPQPQTEAYNQPSDKANEQKTKSIKQMNRHEMGIKTEALDSPFNTGKDKQINFVDHSQELHPKIKWSIATNRHHRPCFTILEVVVLEILPIDMIKTDDGLMIMKLKILEVINALPLQGTTDKIKLLISDLTEGIIKVTLTTLQETPLSITHY